MAKKKEDKQRSLARSKKTVISLGKLLFKGGAGLFPGGGTAAEVAEAGLKHLKDWWDDTRAARFKEFHAEVLEGEGIGEKSDLLQKEFSVEDYYSLVSNAVEDAEDDKVGIYARLFRSIVEGKVEQPYRRHFIRSAKDLSLEEIELMRRVYVNARYAIKGEASMQGRVKALLGPSSDDPLKGICVDRLLRLGFVERPNTWDASESANRLLHKFVEASYPVEDLTPDALGLETWSGLRAIVTMDGTEERFDVQQLIADTLNSMRVQASIQILEKDPLQFAPHLVFLCLRRSSSASDVRSAIDILGRDRFVKIFLEKDDQGGIVDPIPDVHTSSNANFSENTDEEKRNFVRQVVENLTKEQPKD